MNNVWRFTTLVGILGIIFVLWLVHDDSDPSSEPEAPLDAVVYIVTPYPPLFTTKE